MLRARPWQRPIPRRSSVSLRRSPGSIGTSGPRIPHGTRDFAGADCHKMGELSRHLWQKTVDGFDFKLVFGVFGMMIPPEQFCFRLK